MKNLRTITHHATEKTDLDLFKIFVEEVKEYAIFMLDQNGIITSWNKGAKHIKGYEDFEIVGKHFSVFYTAADIDKNKPGLELIHAKETGSYYEEGWRVKKDGTLFMASVTITAVFKEDGSLRGFAKVTRDITTKVVNEQKLKDSKEQIEKTVVELEKVLAYSVDMICTIDAKGYFISLSKASETILGYLPEELIGRKLTELVVEEDVEKTEKFKESVLSGIASTHFENSCYRKDGTVVPLEWSVSWSTEENTMFCVARDVTEEHQLRKAYNNQKGRFYDLFYQAPVCIRVVKGKDHVYEMANPLYLKTFGKEEVVGKTAIEVFPEAQKQGYIQLLDNVYNTGKSFSGTEMLVKVDPERNGKLVDLYINFVYQAYRNTEGIIEGIFFFGTDVTEQVQARKKIEESEKRYGYLIQNLPVAIYTTDPKEHIILYNKAAAALWGNEPTPGKETWCRDCKTYNSDGSELPFNTSPMALVLKENRPIFGKEIIIQSSQGERKNVLPYSTPTFDPFGNVTGTVNMLIDISDRKEAEEKLRSSNERFEIVLRATNDAIWDWNLESGVLYWNKSYERLFGYEELNSSQTIEEWLEKIHPNDKERVKNGLLEKINKLEKNYWHDEYQYFKANGEVVNVFNRGIIMYDTNNKPVRFVGAMQDITARKRNEMEKEQLIEHLTNSNRDLQQFNYITSHNLRAPLSNLIGLLNLVNYDSLDHYNREIVGMFKGSTQQLDETINDLNQILIIKDNVNIEKTSINLTEAFKHVCFYFKFQIETIGASIETSFACEEIIFNKSYLESILTNLLSNSFKYLSPKRRLRIAVRSQKMENGDVLVVFEDNGMGIDLKRNKERIFGLYQRFHSNTTGKGLGLYITKSQITSLGGTIEVESDTEKGTTFYITFKHQS